MRDILLLFYYFFRCIQCHFVKVSLAAPKIGIKLRESGNVTDAVWEKDAEPVGGTSAPINEQWRYFQGR